MSIVSYFVAVIALMLALDNRHSIKEIRYHYNKLYKDSVYGKSVTEDSNEQ